MPIITNNLFTKILALIAAIILWFIVIVVENTVSVLPETLPIGIQNIGANLGLANELPPAKIFIKATKEELKNVTADNFTVTIDAQNYTAGEHNLPVIAAASSGQWQVLKIEPQTVNVRLAPLQEKEVEVQARLIGDPAPGHYVTSITPAQETVIIRGAESYLSAIDHVVAEFPLSENETEDLVSTIELTFERQVNERGESVMPEGTAPVVTIDPEKLEVTVDISSERQEKEVPVRPTFTREEDALTWQDQLTIEPASITIEGDETVVSQVNQIATEAIEVGALQRSFSIQVRLQLPEGAAAAEGEPTTVQISIPQDSERQNGNGGGPPTDTTDEQPPAENAATI